MTGGEVSCGTASGVGIEVTVDALGDDGLSDGAIGAGPSPGIDVGPGLGPAVGGEVGFAVSAP